jgi:hypothetical protein
VTAKSRLYLLEVTVEEHFRIYLDDGKLRVVRVTEHTYGYDDDKFLREDDGTIKTFDDRNLAILYLNKTFKPEWIAGDYLTPNNLAMINEKE